MVLFNQRGGEIKVVVNNNNQDDEDAPGKVEDAYDQHKLSSIENTEKVAPK